MSKILSVTFNEGQSTKRYEYEYTGNKIVEVGDLAVVYVNGNYYGNAGYKLVTVRGITPPGEQCFSGTLKKVVEVISLAEQRREAERERRRARIEKKLDAIVKTRGKTLLYEQIAQVDFEARQLLDELNQL